MDKPNQPWVTPTTQTGPAKLSDVLGGLGDRLASEEHARRVEGQERRDQLRAEQKRDAVIEERRKLLWKERGVRYQGCTLDNFQTATERQCQVKATVQVYGLELAENIRRGVNLILIGPEGTGKDHLLASLFNPALDAGFSIKWTSGAMLWSRLRDGIDGSEAESSIIKTYTRPDILVLSDPQPLFEKLSNYQAAMLYRIVDERVNNCRAIWASLNGRERKDVDAKLSAPIVGRLRDGAVSLVCDWASYRKPLESRRMPEGGTQ